jgi:hypothetical protein
MDYKKSDAYKSVFDLSFYSSGIEDPIGGHIHIGHPIIAWKENFDSGEEELRYYQTLSHEILNKPYTNTEKYKLEEIVSSNRKKLSETMDMLVAFPLMFTEVKEHAIRRKKSYGNLCDYRSKTYGIEYRTTPSWISSEKLAQATLSLAYCAAYDVLNKNYIPEKNFTKIQGFSDNYKIHNIDLLYPFLERAEHEIKNLSLYPKYRTYINYLLFNAKRMNELFGTEIKLGWNIPFEILSNITLLTIKELTEKISKTLSIPKGKPNMCSITQYIQSNSNDFMIPEIRDNMNICLDTILKIKENKKAIYIFAKKREYGDIITIHHSYNIFMDMKKRMKLAKLINIIASEFKYGNTINVKINNGYVTNNENIIAKVGIGRKIREQNTYLAEAILFTILLFINDAIYQGFIIDRKTGKKTIKTIQSKTIVSQFKKNLIGKEKNIPENRIEDIEEQTEEEARQTRHAYYTIES